LTSSPADGAGFQLARRELELRFAVHPPAQRRASPRSHRVPHGDVSSCVHVSVARKGAVPAAEGGLALARPRVNGSARATALGGECRANPFYPARGLVLKALDKQAPSAGKDFPIQSALLAHAPTWIAGRSPDRTGHLADAEILNPNQVECSGQIGRSFFDPVLSRINLTKPQPGDGEPDVGSSARATGGAAESTLKPSQSSLPLRAKAGDFQHDSRGQGGRHGDTPVDAYYLAISRAGDRLRDDCERDVPATCSVKGDPVRLCSGDLSRPAEPHPPRLWDPDVARLAAEPAYVAGLDGDDTESLGSAAFPPSRPAVSTTDEVFYCLVEIAQRLLLDHMTAAAQPVIRRASLGQLSALLYVSGRACPSGPPESMLFDSQIPHETRMSAVFPQDGRLGRRRTKPEPGHDGSLNLAYDNSKEVMRRFSPRCSETPGVAASLTR